MDMLLTSARLGREDNNCSGRKLANPNASRVAKIMLVDGRDDVLRAISDSQFCFTCIN